LSPAPQGEWFVEATQSAERADHPPHTFIMGDLDDLDALLDELREQHPGPCDPHHSGLRKEKGVGDGDGDLDNAVQPETDPLDELIGEVLDDGDDVFQIIETTYQEPSRLHGKCEKPWIRPGGTPCLNLRCMKCDFLVIHFENARWSDAADYLFFRNFHPNRDKLKSRLLLKLNHLASCCQCTWRSVKFSSGGVVTEQSEALSEGLWTCFGH